MRGARVFTMRVCEAGAVRRVRRATAGAVEHARRGGRQLVAVRLRLNCIQRARARSRLKEHVHYYHCKNLERIHFCCASRRASGHQTSEWFVCVCVCM